MSEVGSVEVVTSATTDRDVAREVLAAAYEQCSFSPPPAGEPFALRLATASVGPIGAIRISYTGGLDSRVGDDAPVIVGRIHSGR